MDFLDIQYDMEDGQLVAFFFSHLLSEYMLPDQGIYLFILGLAVISIYRTYIAPICHIYKYILISGAEVY